jgi:DUF4097 and DUF4098 domain-containing protein YvlB
METTMLHRRWWVATTILVALGIAGVDAQAQEKNAPPSDAQQQQPPPPIQARPGSPETTPRSTYENPAPKGSRLVISNNAGEVVIRAWDRDQLRVEASHSAREKLDVVQENESTIRVRTRSERRASGLVDYRISVPRWMPVNLSGTYLEADVEGTAAEVTVETVGGNVRVSGGSGAVSLRSVEGTITVEKTTGRVQASAVNEGIRLSNTQGEVIVDSINGDVVIENAQTSSLEVSTVNGDVTFNGSVRDNGVYRLTTHGGDIRVGLGGAANAIVFVRTFQGDFSADFPIQLPEGQSGQSGSKRFNFTLGSGSARIEVQSFSGDIHLARTKATSAEEERRNRRKPNPNPRPPKELMGLAWNIEDLERLSERALLEAGKALADTEKHWKDFKIDWNDFEKQLDENVEKHMKDLEKRWKEWDKPR